MLVALSRECTFVDFGLAAISAAADLIVESVEDFYIVARNSP